MIRLVVTLDQWRTILRAAVDPALIALGRTGFHSGGTKERILLREVSLLPRERYNDASQAQDCVFLAGSFEGKEKNNIGQLLKTLVPNLDRLTMLWLGRNENCGQVCAIHYRGGKRFRIDELEVIGLAHGVIPLNGKSSGVKEGFFGDKISGLYSRIIGALGESSWQRLRQSSVAIVGCGGSGWHGALQLALLGVNKLTLIDGDVIERGNRGVMFAREADEGRPKVEALRDFLTSIRPQLQVKPLKVWAQDSAGLAAMREADLILTTVDNNIARLVAARIASAYMRLHIDIGTGVHRFANETEEEEKIKADGQEQRRILGADIRLFLPGDSCIYCLGGVRNVEEAAYDLAAPPGSLRIGRARHWYEERAGSLPTLNTVAVGLGLTLWHEYLCGRIESSLWLRAFLGAGRGGGVEIVQRNVRADRSSQCENCRELGKGDSILASPLDKVIC